MKRLSQLFVLITVPMTVSFVVVVLLVGSFGTNAGPPPNIPGDVNCDGVYSLSDCTYILNNLFNDGPLPRIIHERRRPARVLVQRLGDFRVSAFRRAKSIGPGVSRAVSPPEHGISQSHDRPVAWSRKIL